ncbi:GH16 domain-containing protein [Favolaschia claudopus]|uniref:GH16 domain-containing protein n=1 Tax=Favolaschia claudopus TaxID=2862362 RepID=A0AAW0E1K8_9AGAR
MPRNSHPASPTASSSKTLAIRPAIYRAQAPPPSAGLDDDDDSDDEVHESRVARLSRNSICNARGLQNVGCLVMVYGALLALFIGYPIATELTHKTPIAFNLNINSTGQHAVAFGNRGLIDEDTPIDKYQIPSYHDPNHVLQLVFSDEFETEGRSFYPGDDPYWEAVDLHYWQTGNLEWYDPAAITTRNGALEINLTKVDDPSKNHNLDYTGGMLSTWNKFCFTGGLIVTNVMLPGINNVFGLWPAVWTLGNLGRAGYGATLDGMWPYSYDACDVGTLPNQTLLNGPPAALNTGPDNGVLSVLPGQKLSRCTCHGESHPGPTRSDGSYVGRSAPEIDIFEGQIGGPDGAHLGQVSQSAQWAPFNAGYIWDNSSANQQVVDWSLSHHNTYTGGIYQQPTSVVTTTNQACYQLIDGCYAVQGFEYVPGYDDAVWILLLNTEHFTLKQWSQYITWITDDKVSWTLNAAGVGADPATNISARPISQEPMYIIANLGISQGFGFVDFAHLTFPATMRLDWIRVYQHPDKINIGCNPAEYPTSDYINQHIQAYTDPLLTTWVGDYKQPFPKNKLINQC